MPVRDEGHQRHFKNANKNEEMRRRRQETSVELRKAKKDEQIMKRRNIDSDDVSASDDTHSPENTPSAQMTLLPLAECLPIFQKNLGGEKRLCATASIRRLLSRQNQPPIEEVLKMGLVPHLINALTLTEPKICFEAAWALTNIASGTSEQTRVLVDAGVIGPMAALLVDDSPLYIQEQAVWALGNIAGDCAQLRNAVIDAGVGERMIHLIQDRQDISTAFLRNLCWPLANLMRHRAPYPPDSLTVRIVEVLEKLIQHHDRQVAVDSCWALCYISDGPNDRIQFLVSRPGLLKYLITVMLDCCKKKDYQMLSPALRALGNCVTGSDEQTQLVLDAGILDSILPVLQTHRPALQREAIWLMSNLTAGTPLQIQQVICSGLLSEILQLMMQADCRTQAECVWCCCNLTFGATIDQVGFLVQLGAIPVLCDLLQPTADPKMLACILDCIQNLLCTAEKLNESDQMCLCIEECLGLDKIEKLQQHENENIYAKALHIIENFFGEDDKENVPVCNDGELHFKSDETSNKETFSFT